MQDPSLSFGGGGRGGGSGVLGGGFSGGDAASSRRAKRPLFFRFVFLFFFVGQTVYSSLKFAQKVARRSSVAQGCLKYKQQNLAPGATIRIHPQR